MMHYLVNNYTLIDSVLILIFHCTKQVSIKRITNLMEIIVIWGSWRLLGKNKECINLLNTQMID